MVSKKCSIPVFILFAVSVILDQRSERVSFVEVAMAFMALATLSKTHSLFVTVAVEGCVVGVTLFL